jgi:hypothetical protein
MTSLLFVFIPDYSNNDSCKPLKGNGIDCIIKYNSTNNPFTKTGTYNQYKNLSSFLEFSNQDNLITTSESPHQNSSNGDSENINSDEEVSALESYDEDELPNNFINNSQLSKQTKNSESFDQIPDTFIGRYQATGVPVKLNISSCDDRNAIICGSSGKGKSSLLKYLIYKYVKYHESCFVFDVVNSDFSNEKILIE